MDYKRLKQIVQRKGYKWFEKPFQPNIIGIRTELIVPNVMNDLKFVAWVDDKGKEFLISLTQTTLPGKYWLEHPSRPNGCFILMPGQYIDCWIKGTHGTVRPHDALLQLGGPVNGWRDNDKDDIPEMEGPMVTIERGKYIGCNHHGPWQQSEVKLIDANSAACQVTADKKYHEQMMWVVDQYYKSVLGYIPTSKEIMEDETKKLWVRISYTLLLEKDLKG